MNNSAIIVKNTTKIYRIYEKSSDRLKESLHIFSRKYHRDFFALNNIDFVIEKGETVGIIGVNGSGKSTLLKIITGILQPTEGEVIVNGKISAILELGAGFNPEYTGIENIYNNGMISGFSRSEMKKKIDEIVEFAELGDFINQPVKTYSSGMYARLAFSVAININPDILIIDEALSVGDMAFQHKCMLKMKELTDKGVTLIFVSHDTHAVKSLCDRCIYLEKGKIKADGSALVVTDQYLTDTRVQIYRVEAEEISEANNERQETVSNIQNENLTLNGAGSYGRYGTGGAKITEFRLLNSQGFDSDHFEYNEPMEYAITIECFKTIKNLNVCLLIRDKNGIDITGTTTFEEGIQYPILYKGDKIKVIFKSLNVLKHDMTFSVSITVNDTRNIADQTILDAIPIIYTFKSVYNPKRPVWYAFYQDFEIKYHMEKSVN